MWPCEREAISEFSSHLEMQLANGIYPPLTTAMWHISKIRNHSSLRGDHSLFGKTKQSCVNTEEQHYEQKLWCVKTNVKISTMWTDIPTSSGIFGSKYCISWHSLNRQEPRASDQVSKLGSYGPPSESSWLHPRANMARWRTFSMSLLPFCMTFPFQVNSASCFLPNMSLSFLL